VPEHDDGPLTAPNDALVLTVPQVARLLQTSPDLIYDSIRRKELPAIRLGRVLRVSRFALENWIARQGVEEAPSMVTNLNKQRY